MKKKMKDKKAALAIALILRLHEYKKRADAATEAGDKEKAALYRGKADGLAQALCIADQILDCRYDVQVFELEGDTKLAFKVEADDAAFAQKLAEEAVKGMEEVTDD